MSPRRARRRIIIGLSIAVLAPLAGGCAAGGRTRGVRPTAKPRSGAGDLRPRAHPVEAPRWVSIRIPAGRTVRQFQLSEPSGVIRVFSLTLPVGTHGRVTATIPALAGVQMSVPSSRIPSETCRREGAAERCTQSEEACPMPAADWHFRLNLTGPAGSVHLRFVVAPSSPVPARPA